MNQPVPISHERRSVHHYPRPPTLRHETDSSSTSDFDEHGGSFRGSGSFSPPAFTSINSRSNSGSIPAVRRPISLPLPTLEPSLGYPARPGLISPGELRNPMSIAAALARTAAADLPPQNSAQAAAGIHTAGRSHMSHGGNNGAAAAGAAASAAGSPRYPSSVGGGDAGLGFSDHQRSHSAGSHREPGMMVPPPLPGVDNSGSDTQSVVEQLRAMGQSLHEASRAQRRLVDETMHKWNSEKGK